MFTIHDASFCWGGGKLAAAHRRGRRPAAARITDGAILTVARRGSRICPIESIALL
jgi:hypothetical protein